MESFTPTYLGLPFQATKLIKFNATFLQLRCATPTTEFPRVMALPTSPAENVELWLCAYSLTTPARLTENPNCSMTEGV